MKPHAVMSYILLATEAMRVNDYKKSESILRSINPIREGEAPVVGVLIVPFLVAWTRAGQGEYEDALTVLNAMETSANKEVVQYHKALVYDHMGNKNAAKWAYDTSLSGNIKPYHFIQAAGSFYIRNQMSEKAKTLYEEYQSVNPTTDFFAIPLKELAQGKQPVEKTPTIQQGYIEILMEGVRIAYQNELYTEAMAYLQMIRYLDPHYPQSLILLSNHYEDKQDYAQANYFYSLIEKGSDFYNKTQINLARNYYLMENKEKAEKLLRELTEAEPLSYAAPLELADLLREDERYSLAASVYTQVISRILEPKREHWYIYYTKGISHERAGEWEGAETALLKALELNPSHPDVLNYLGYSWLVMEKNVDQAQKMIEEAVAARPNDAHIMDSMGWALYHVGKYDKAVKYLEQAVETMPYDTIMNEHLGDVYWHVGRQNEARFQWQRVVDDATEEEYKEKILQKLEQGLGDAQSSKDEASIVSQNSLQ